MGNDPQQVSTIIPFPDSLPSTGGSANWVPMWYQPAMWCQENPHDKPSAVRLHQPNTRRYPGSETQSLRCPRCELLTHWDYHCLSQIINECLSFVTNCHFILIVDHDYCLLILDHSISLLILDHDWRIVPSMATLGPHEIHNRPSVQRQRPSMCCDRSRPRSHEPTGMRRRINQGPAIFLFWRKTKNLQEARMKIENRAVCV